MTKIRKKSVIILVCIITCCVLYWFVVDPHHQLEIIYTQSQRSANWTESLWDAQTEGEAGGMDKDGSGKMACNFPVFDPFSSEAMKFYKKSPTTSCPNGLPTITSYNGVAVIINQTYKQQKMRSQKVVCWYRTVEYQRRIDYINGDWLGPFKDFILVEGKPDFVEVKCVNDAGKTVSKMHHYIVKQDERNTEPIPKLRRQFSNDQLNVLLLGIDSLSSQLFQRAMPKTRKFLLESLNATEMKKYNKIGDNTFPNLLAISAGVDVNDLKNWSMSEGFDMVPFLWKEFKSAGYRTQYLTDRADFDDFTTAPTDSFNLPMLRALMKDKIAFDNDCFEDKIEVKLWLDLHLEFARDSLLKGGRYFTLGMLKRPTHDYPNRASAVDELYLNFFKEMQDTGLLDNTFMVFFGDHGPRTGAYRHTFLGSIEERTPSVVIYLPPWFRKQYFSYYQNLLYNSDVLTTNFDIHATVQSLLSFPNISSTRNTVVYKSETGVNRAQNLFTKISPKRTCADASVPPHFCMCNGGFLLSESESLQKMFGEQVVKDINSQLDPKLTICVRLKLKSVISLTFLNGHAGSSGTYRVILKTVPGDAMFEATIQYTVRFYFFTKVKVLGMVSRINMYRGQSDCVQEDKVLRMYCYCKNVLEKTHPTVTIQR